MNYMPDMAHFAFPRAAAGRLTIASLCAHFERVLPYTRLILRPKRQRKVWVDGRANGASVELVPISKQQRSGIVQANPTFAPAEDIVRLCSGPNHDYTYLPIFYDVDARAPPGRGDLSDLRGGRGAPPRADDRSL